MADEIKFTKVDWDDFYPDAQEAIPHDAPIPKGNLVPYAQSATKTDYCLVNTKISKINCEF